MIDCIASPLKLPVPQWMSLIWTSRSGTFEISNAPPPGVPGLIGTGLSHDTPLESSVNQPSEHSLVLALRDVPALGALDGDTLLQLVGASANLHWRADSRVFSKGDEGDALYVVLSGAVSVRDDGTEIKRIDPGDYLGERALVRDEPRTLDAVALEDSELMVVPKEAVSRLLDERPELAAAVRARLDEIDARDASRGDAG
jgi:CRP-like cAMP-binding protein